jgi:hypothetical protein
MAYFNFASWEEAPQAKPFYLDENPNLRGYNCAPRVFYFRPQKKWHMIFQLLPGCYFCFARFQPVGLGLQNNISRLARFRAHNHQGHPIVGITLRRLK